MYNQNTYVYSIHKNYRSFATDLERKKRHDCREIFSQYSVSLEGACDSRSSVMELSSTLDGDWNSVTFQLQFESKRKSWRWRREEIPERIHELAHHLTLPGIASQRLAVKSEPENRDNGLRTICDTYTIRWSFFTICAIFSILYSLIQLPPVIRGLNDEKWQHLTPFRPMNGTAMKCKTP